MSTFVPRDLERLRYWQGQMLRSRDLRDQLAIDSQLRWWHNRALHQSFGIAEGFAVGQPSSGSVVVQAGVAYDVFGREVLLDRDQPVALPAANSPQPMTLLVSCRAEATFSPAFAWKPSAQVGARDGVPLAQVIFDSGKPSLTTQGVIRQARPQASPTIASGSTIPGHTAWQRWIWNARDDPIGFTVRIDATAAGFTQVPCYFAWLEWPPSLDVNNALLVYGELFGALVLNSTYVGESSVEGFTFYLHPNSFAGRLFPVIQQLQPYVGWLGIQPADTAATRQKLAQEVQHGSIG